MDTLGMIGIAIVAAIVVISIWTAIEERNRIRRERAEKLARIDEANRILRRIQEPRTRRL